MAQIFISRSSRDNDAADRMKAWLANQGFENAFLDKDKTTGIPPGADWEKRLYREAGQSQLAIKAPCRRAALSLPRTQRTGSISALADRGGGEPAGAAGGPT